MFFNYGLNDTYLLRTSTGKYILRVYRLGWRSLSDILYELDMLLHLQSKGVSVSFPLTMRDGSLLSTLNTLEGPRNAVLFTYAEGKPPPRLHGETNETSETYSLRYGRAAAQIHNALDDFSCQHTRFFLDLDHLLDKPVQTILPLLAERPDDQAYLLRVVDSLKEQVARLPVSELEWGVCHGDFHGGNAHVTEKQLTFFDFDCCGPGWRAYDIAVFRWAGIFGHRDEKLWEAFLAGYRQHRTLQPVDMAAVSVFAAIRQIWLQGLHTANAPDWGYSSLNDRYFDESMNILRECIKRIDYGS
jgi:Ser/Thr protein kinase RdoA (MazF antagonist)